MQHGQHPSLLVLRDRADECLVWRLLLHGHATTSFPKPWGLNVLLLWGLLSNSHRAVSAMWLQGDWELRPHKSPLPST